MALGKKNITFTKRLMISLIYYKNDVFIIYNMQIDIQM